MEVHGDLNMMQNQLQNVALEEVTAFPVSPVKGQFCFKSKIVHICADVIDGVPSWIPMTNEIMTYVHTQSTADIEWVVEHNLGKDVIVQVVDANGEVMIPNSINIDSSTKTIIGFGNGQQGRAICIAADNGGGINTVTAHIHEQEEESDTWTIQHDLGYQPIIQVVLADKFQIIPNEVEHVDLSQTVVRFTQPQLGKARLI